MTSTLRPRVALLSIAAFWSLYFVILTARSAIIYQVHVGLENRAIVSVASMGITALFYLILRRIPIARLGLAIAVAALVAAPAAYAYSAFNYAVFSVWRPHPIKWPDHHAAPASSTRMPAAPSAPSAPAPPQAPQGITVGPAMDEEPMTALQSIADQAANGYFFFCSWAALYLALCYAGEVGRLARRAAALETAARSAELRALRYQVNPHFLFNTLNSLSSLVMTGKAEQAEAMILNLATFFRTSLTGDPTEDVALAEEIQLQRLYLDIERVRFPSRLVIDIALPPALARACVPGLILQPLVENAVKHGVSRARHPVTIRVSAAREGDRLVLRVADDGDAALGSAEAGTGVGLANVADRLAARYGDKAKADWGSVPGGGFAVTLRMPLSFDGC